MEDLSAFVRNGFDRIRRGQDPYQPTQETGLSKSTRRRIEDHFTTVNNSIALRKATRFLQGVDDPTEDEQFAQKRIAAARQNSQSAGFDEDQRPDDVEVDAAPAYGFGDGPEFIPNHLRIGGDWFAALKGAAEAKDRMQQARQNQPRSRQSK